MAEWHRASIHRHPIATLATPDDLICAIIRHEPTLWIGGADEGAISRFLAAARDHGVLPLLGAAFARGHDFDSWPQKIPAICHASLLVGTLLAAAQRVEVVRVLDALASAGVRPLLLKGIALASRHYPDPALRPRADTDLLIPPNRRDDVARVLAQIGYTESTGIKGDFVSYQSTWSREDERGVASHLDVHWRINNSQILAKLMSYQELAARSVPLPAVGPYARALADVDALLFACIHRTGHANAPYQVPVADEPTGDRLIWLYDIHLLFSRMSAPEQEEFAERAAEKRIRAICRDALQRSAECFGTPIPARVREALGAPSPVEASARYFSGGPLRQMVGDFVALESWRDRRTWLRETAFPPVDYMRRKYPDSPRGWLPLLYARRGWGGIAQRVRSRSSGHRS